MMLPSRIPWLLVQEVMRPVTGMASALSPHGHSDVVAVLLPAVIRTMRFLRYLGQRPSLPLQLVRLQRHRHERLCRRQRFELSLQGMAAQGQAIEAGLTTDNSKSNLQERLEKEPCAGRSPSLQCRTSLL